MTILCWRLILVAVLLLPAIASAQVAELGAWWDRPIVRNLGLSEDQQKQIRAVVRESREHLIRLRGDVESAEAEMRDQMNEEKLDATRIDATTERVVASRAELVRAVSHMGVRLRMVLTLSQWQELQTRRRQSPIIDSAPAMHRGPGPAGPPTPRPRGTGMREGLGSLPTHP
jgi:Spy/CpxP family protein refolding chaperone